MASGELNVKLLTIEEVQRGLDAEFRPLEPSVTGLRLIAKDASPAAVSQVQSRLKVQFPEAFMRIISRFDLGDLAIGPVNFCGSGDYLAELLQCNEEVKWWGPGVRPLDRLMVANSDPYAFLLNVANGRISAFDREQSWSQAIDVAEDFENFIRGVGTAMLLRAQEPDKEALGRAVARDVGAATAEFWIFLAR